MIRRGLTWLGLGGAISILSYYAAAPGQHYVVLIGPLVVGSLLVFEGLVKAIGGEESRRALLAGCRIITSIAVAGILTVIIVAALAVGAALLFSPQSAPAQWLQTFAQPEYKPTAPPAFPSVTPTAQVQQWARRLWLCREIVELRDEPSGVGKVVGILYQRDGRVIEFPNPPIIARSNWIQISWESGPSGRAWVWLDDLCDQPPAEGRAAQATVTSSPSRLPSAVVVAPTPTTTSLWGAFVDAYSSTPDPWSFLEDYSNTPASKGGVSKSRPAIPAGMGGLIVVNYYGQEMNYTIGGQLYKIAGNDQQVVFLPPGAHNYSANIPGLGNATGTIEIVEGRYFIESWAD